MRKFKEYTKEEFRNTTEEEFDIYEKERREFVMKYVYDLIESGVKTFINDHDGKEEKLEAIVELDNGYVCPVGMCDVWGLNKLYVGGQDEKIHLSRISVGGDFGRYTTQSDGNGERFMKRAIEEYNKSRECVRIISYKII